MCLSQTLAAEVAPFGICVTLVEPGPYRTSFLDSARTSEQHPDYEQVRTVIAPVFDDVGDPRATRDAVLQLVDSDQPTLRLFLGRSFQPVEAEYHERLQTWREWQPVALAAFG